MTPCANCQHGADAHFDDTTCEAYCEAIVPVAGPDREGICGCTRYVETEPVADERASD